MDEVKLARIVSFQGSWGSGIAYLTVQEIIGGDIITLQADSGPLGRALSQCYGADLPGHVIDNAVIAGKLIYYGVDELGMLAGFTPAEALID